jgi:hypothetical protein
MKIFFSIILIVYIFWIFPLSYAASKTNVFQSFKVTHTKGSNLSVNQQKTFRFNFEDNAGEIISLMESALFVTGVVMYFTYNSDNFLNINQYSYKNTGLILMGISLGGGFIQVLGSSGYYGGGHYGPRSSLHKKQNIQLSFNGQALGLRMNF